MNSSNVSYIINFPLIICNAVKEIKTTLYYKLSYKDSFSNNTKKKIKELCQNFCKNSNINIAFFFILKVAIYFRLKTVYQVVRNPLLYTSLFVQDVSPAILVKLNVIYQQGLMNIW